MTTYLTKQGDTFDIISKKFYGKETYINDLIQANIQYKDVVFFSANTELDIPDIDTTANTETVKNAPWR